MAEKLVMFTTVMLDQARRIRFRPGVARYRFGVLKKPLQFEAMSKPKTFETALCQWLWVCLDEDCELDSPEAIAEAIQEHTVDQKIDLYRTLVDCVNLYKPTNESKNGNGSTPSPLPASS